MLKNWRPNSKFYRIKRYLKSAFEATQQIKAEKPDRNKALVSTLKTFSQSSIYNKGICWISKNSCWKSPTIFILFAEKLQNYIIIPSLFLNLPLFPRYSSLFPRYSSLFPRYSSLFPRYSSLFLRYSSLFPRYSSLFLRYSSLFSRYSSLFPRYSSLFFRYSPFIPPLSSFIPP